ncbi:radical SAM/SPASM domain-containing protein [Enterococcus faecalis]|uniref:radical SAM/SPASM domain-containing protein n=1 Tax=Enterococcus faecalis TaxID=1351 RepID=UPI002DB6E650|nr:radical SAM protein [Enterococcus faecalis]MEB7954571.1 radical SAM protein [Enterococcus faecalis]MEB7964702.1 radical SAM protein [Enterococcus faecalis]
MNTELYLTDSCNMQCSFCGSWNQNGVCNNLDITDIKKYLTELHTKGYRYLSLSGGEPFLYEKLYEVIEFANQKGFLTNVTTNGLLIDEDYISFVRNKNVVTRISLHTLDSAKYKKLTGIDGLERIKQSISLLKDSCGMFGLGMTVSEYNNDEVFDLAKYALNNNASYIRFTPVYRVYKGTEFKTNSKSFFDLLSNITKIILEQYNELEMKSSATIFGEDVLNIYTTKPCGAGSEVYVALNPDLNLIPCPVLPHYFELPSEKYSSYENVLALRKQYSDLMNSIDIEQLKGKCASCLYKSSCKGGCLSTKLEGGLSLLDEQPICIYEIVHDVLLQYTEDEKKKIINYWNYWNKKTSVGASDKGCIRRLPIWEIHFRRKMEYRNVFRH